MAKKEKRISWKTEYHKLLETHEKAQKQHAEALATHDEMLNRFNDAESLAESRQKLILALREQNASLKRDSELFQKLQEKLRYYIYTKDYNFFGGVNKLKADLIKAL